MTQLDIEFKQLIDRMTPEELKAFAIGMFSISLLVENPFLVSDAILIGDPRYISNPVYDKEIQYTAKVLAELGEVAIKFQSEQN